MGLVGPHTHGCSLETERVPPAPEKKQVKIRNSNEKTHYFTHLNHWLVTFEASTEWKTLLL